MQYVNEITSFDPEIIPPNRRSNEHMVQVMILNIHKRYIMDLRTCTIYDTKTLQTVGIFKSNGKLWVNLEDDINNKIYVVDLNTIACYALYHFTSDHITYKNEYIMDISDYPFNARVIYPDHLSPILSKDKEYLYINNIPFKRWKNSIYYVSKSGAVYSLYSHALMKYKYSFGYGRASTTSTGKKNSMIHRMVYETWVGEIPPDKQVDHIDNTTWNNNVENLQLLSPKENMRKMIYFNMKVWSEEELIAIGDAILRNESPRKIEREHGLYRNYVMDIKYGRRYKDFYDAHGYDFSKCLKRKRTLTDDQVREIRRRYAEGGITYHQLAVNYNLTDAAIEFIVRRLSYKSVE